MQLRSLVTKLQNRRRVYRYAFGTDEGAAVLADLRKFCHYGDEKFVKGDPLATAQLLGREQVFRRILGYLQLDDERLNNLLKDAQKREESIYG